MRIALIAPPWLPVPPPAYGGTESMLDCLARGLVEAGHEVLLWTTGDSTCPVPKAYLYEQAVPQEMGSAAVELAHVLTGYETVRAWEPDVVHDHTLTGPVHAERYDGLCVVTTNHGPFESSLAVLYESLAGRVSIVAISEDHATRAAFPVDAVIPHGIDVDRICVGDGQGDGDGPYLLNLSRMSPDKGVHLAAQAAHETGRRLLIAAKMREPAEHTYFTEEVEPLLDDGVRYVGEVGHHEKMALLGGASALLNPIQWPEPFGLVMVESLATGTPVIAWADGSATELVEHGRTGYLCTFYEEVCAAIVTVDLLDRAACRASAEQRFSRQRMAADHVAFYERVTAPCTT